MLLLKYKRSSLRMNQSTTPMPQQEYKKSNPNNRLIPIIHMPNKTVKPQDADKAQ